MSSRDKILKTLKQNQPVQAHLPLLTDAGMLYNDLVAQYMEILHFIGGAAYKVESYSQVATFIKQNFSPAQKIVSTLPEFAEFADVNPTVADPHDFDNVELFITTSDLAVAENGAVWVKDDQLPARALPFIAQQLAVIIKQESIVATMHHAYDVIAGADYGFATFIAGPSKTADIAQSLVLGAHGPKSMMVFVI